MLKINELSLNIVNEIVDKKEQYGVDVIKLNSGATVLDMTNASWIGGKLVGEICMGGLGSVEFTSYKLDGHYLPAVNVYTSEPIISCMASQLAGWSVKLKKEVEKDGQIKKKVVFIGNIGYISLLVPLVIAVVFEIVVLSQLILAF